MKQLILLLVFGLTAFQFGLSQNTNATAKGAKPIANTIQIKGITRAVIVGISDYQSPEIPDLKFADKDAIAFAEWLQSPAGGSVVSANIQLLTNQNATQGKFGAALDWLKDACNEGDQAIIYFSGHGDIEVSLRTQPGFLLCWDAPPKVYTAGGAFGLVYLQDIISTISIDKKAQVLVIADACHSGKLAGSGIGGSQATAMALKQQFANETKILSCQPNEYSIEGTQWGGGRGVFSYHLLEGLTGLADRNNDKVVSLSEIDQYLGESVVVETKPQTQTPFTIGDRQSIISYVNSDALAALIKSKKYQNEVIETIGFKGTVDNYLKSADTLIKRIYRDFENAIQRGELLEASELNQSANELFLQINQLDPSNPLINLMRRKLASVMQDEVQQALNAVLDDNPYEVNNWRFNDSKYNRYPKYLQRIIELLGTKHYLYKPLMAKKLFFEAFNLVHYSAYYYHLYSDSSKLAARRKLHEALNFDDNAFVYYLLANSFIYSIENDSVDTYYKKAMALAPNWKLPYSEISWHYLDFLSQYTKAEKWLRAGLSIDPNSYTLLEMDSWLYQHYENIDSIEAICSRMRKLHPDLMNDYMTLAFTYAHVHRNYKLLESYARKANQSETINNQDWLFQFLFINTRKWNKVNPIAQWRIQLFSGLTMFNEKSILDIEKMDSILKQSLISENFSGEKYNLMVDRGILNTLMKRYDTAEFLLLKTLSMEGSREIPQIRGLSYLGLICSHTGRIKEAEAFFIKASMDHPEFNNYQYKPSFSEGYYLYGNFLAEQNRFKEAKEKYQYINKKDYGCVLGLYGMATLCARQGKDKEALDWLEKALDWYFPRPEPIYEETFFNNIRKTKRFKDMMEKNFPEGWE